MTAALVSALAGDERFHRAGSNTTFTRFMAGTIAAAENVSTNETVVASAAWVCAEGGGGQIVKADRTSAGAWETFTISDVNGGSVQHVMLSGFARVLGSIFMLILEAEAA